MARPRDYDDTKLVSRDTTICDEMLGGSLHESYHGLWDRISATRAWEGGNRIMGTDVGAGNSNEQSVSPMPTMSMASIEAFSLQRGSLTTSRALLMLLFLVFSFFDLATPPSTTPVSVRHLWPLLPPQWRQRKLGLCGRGNEGSQK